MYNWEEIMKTMKRLSMLFALLVAAPVFAANLTSGTIASAFNQPKATHLTSKQDLTIVYGGQDISAKADLISPEALA
jgi:hypothetical protein